MKKVKKNIIDNINLELENYKPNNFPETFDLVIYYYFLAIYYKKTDLNKYRQYLEYSKDQLNKILNNLRKYDIPLGSWYGFTGIAYMIRELYGECQILYSIENFVKDQSLKLIVNGKNHDLFNGKYDLLNGLTGILSYFITYHNEQLNYIEECLNWMIKLFEEDCEIIKSKNIWIKNKYITNPIFKKKYSEGYIDLGAAHGIIDFLYIFSLAKKNNIKCNKLDEKYNKILEFYINMFVFSNDTYWPQIITNNENDRKYVYKKRFAWCYGKLGIIRILFCAANNTENIELKSWMIQEMKKIDINDLNLECPTFCHGYSGLYLIINLFYIETKDDYFRILSNVLERKIWQMGNKNNKYYFYKYDKDYINNKDIYEYEKLNSIDGLFSILIPYFLKESNYFYNMYTKSLFLV